MATGAGGLKPGQAKLDTVKTRNVACMGEGATVKLLDNELVEYSHCKTQVVNIVTKETVPGDYEWVPNYLTDMSLIKAATFCVPSLGLPPMAMVQAKHPASGKPVWQAIWEKPADVKFPLKAEISFEYKTNLGDKGERKIEKGEFNIKDPAIKEKACCVVM